MTDHIATLEEMMRSGMEDAMSRDEREAVLAAIALMRGQSEVGALRGALVDIHAFAHRESSGPEVPDDLWTIRNMAATALQERDDA